MVDAKAGEREGSLDFGEFKTLVALEETRGERLTQRELASRCDMSLGTVNKALARLGDRGLVEDGMIDDAGIDELEPYRVRRAVLVAAGFGSRMVPVTLNTPKPLVRVHGRRIIDSLLDPLIAVGIEEIYVVRGYLAEQFDQLLYDYPTIRFLENPLYNEANNISSLMQAKDLLQNAYVMESDLLLRNPALVSKYQYRSNYLGIPVDQTDDWCFPTKNGVIKGMVQGGVDCHLMIGLSYWTAEDGRKLSEDIPSVFAEPGGKERFWDYVPLRYRAGNYKVHVRECRSEDVCEIDTFRELQALDPAYAIR